MFFVALKIPFVQRFVAEQVCSTLEEELKTKVSIDRIEIGLPNRIIIDGLCIEDRDKQKMLDSKRLSAMIDILPLLKGEISISSVQLFGLDAHITKANQDAPLNCQFVIDAFKSKDDEPKKPLNLHISSVVIRNSTVTYDRLDLPRHDGLFDVNHLAVNKLSGHIMIPALTDDSMLFKVKKLSFTEKSSGLDIRNLRFELSKDSKQVALRDFYLNTTGSELNLSAIAKMDGKEVTAFNVSSLTANLSTQDLSLFIPKLNGLDKNINITTKIQGDNQRVKIQNLKVSSEDKSLMMGMDIKVNKSPDLNIDISGVDIHIASNFADDVLVALGSSDLQQYINELQYIDYRGNASYSSDAFTLKGLISTAVGDIDHNISFESGNLSADIKTPLLHLENLKVGKPVGDIKASVNFKANVPGDVKNIVNGLKNIRNGSLKADIPLLTFKDYPLENIVIDAVDRNNALSANISINDKNVITKADFTLSDFLCIINNSASACRFTGNVDVQHFSPDNLGIPTRWGQTDFCFNTNVEIADVRDLLKDIDLNVGNFVMRTSEQTNHFGDIVVNCERSAVMGTKAKMHSDFCDVSVDGHFKLNTLYRTLTNTLVAKIPTLPGFPKYQKTDDDIRFDISVVDASALKKLLNIDLVCDEPIIARGFINDRTEEADFTFKAPTFSFNGKQYKGTEMKLFSNADTLALNSHVGIVGKNGNVFKIQLDANASGNTMHSTLAFNNGGKKVIGGEIYADSHFDKDINGQTVLYMDILPSLLITDNILWNVRPSELIFSDNRLYVNKFKVEHDGQYVVVNGVASNNPADSLIAELHDIDVESIMDIVNFHSVQFSGQASGKAVASSLFDTPQAYTTLEVRDFRFATGRMGTLYANGRWNPELGQIDINAQCKGNPFTGEDKTTTYIDGFISPVNNTMSLSVKADDTPAEFMEGFCGSFVQNVEMTIKGDYWIGGSLKALDMTGDVLASGTMGFQSLGTTYRFDDAHILLSPGTITLDNDTIYDLHGQKGFASGVIHHTRLGRWTYDIDVSASHLECFNFPTLKQGQAFCGYVVGSGKCKITGHPGETVFDVEASPEKGSFVTYDVSLPDALQNQEFITWGTVSDGEMTDSSASSVASSDNLPPVINLKSNVRMNLLVRCTPESSLRFLMDSKTGDQIELFGSGVIRAGWHNKNGMQIFGNYMVDHGKYHMTMKNVVEKDFDFLPEGGLIFNGNPFESILNLHAKYTVNSVPLSDLNIGRSFSNNTTRVNCLMNIGGTASSPKVDFALELPQASADIQQMITSLINSEDEMNQQVVYLLAIGRFYNNTQKDANASASTSQTSLAMQSFISGTVSQKFNSAISGLINNNNWNFGANISPGDEGMNNAEYEGTISGRVLNNRLLIDGQFGYRDNQNATSSFIGDFDLRYLLVPSGNVSIHVYNQTSDRYFSRNTLNTQGIGIILKHDFTHFSDLFRWRRKTIQKK